jgi:hypothetical protein
MSIDRRSLVQMTSRRGFIAAGALATYSLIPVKSSLAACTNGNPLEPLLDAAAAAFNSASSSGSSAAWLAYGYDYLDPQVTLVTMSGKPLSPRDGPNGVIAYLQLNQDQDQFLLPPCSFKTSTSTLAVGKGYWKDNNNGCSFSASTCPKINYLFKYTSLDPTIAKIYWMHGTNA